MLLTNDWLSLYLYIKKKMEEQIIIGKRASSNFFRKMGTLINLEKGLYKAYESVLGLTSGTWKKMPKFEYILLFKTLYIKCEGCSPEDFDDDKGAIYQLSLVYNKNRKLIVHESKMKEEVFSLAKKLQLFFNIKIRDSASDRRNPVWLYQNGKG
jgi:hypothetical protein